VLLALALPAGLCAQAPPAPPKTVSVGVYEAPPWSMKGPDGKWRGLTVDLWNEIAGNLGLTNLWVEEPPDKILDAIARGELDTAAAPFASTMERQQLVDFTHDYLSTGIGVAVLRRTEKDRWLNVLEALATPTAVRFYLLVLVVTLIAGAALWFLERKRNPMFSKRPVPGIGAAFWWAGVTTAAVGYGDKVPITPWGRVLALFWMFISLVLVTALTAFVTAHLAVAEFGQVRGVSSLRDSIVGGVEGSASADWLRREDLPHRLYPTVPAALAGLVQGDVKAVVYSQVTLRYYVARDAQRRFEVLPGALDAQKYAFPLRDESPLRNRMNAQLRSILAEPRWRDQRDRYLGDAAAGSAAVK
jgi:polar amino acid transport system substrate-binding protein